MTHALTLHAPILSFRKPKPVNRLARRIGDPALAGMNGFGSD